MTVHISTAVSSDKEFQRQVTTQLNSFFQRLASLPNYANDAAAAIGGVAIGDLYRNGSVVQIRVT